MSGETVRIWTHDYGPIDVPEPEWCIADHGPVVGHRSDIQHDSGEVELQVRTDRHGLMSTMPVCYTQRPYSPTDTRILVQIELDEARGLTDDEAELVAQALETQAAVIRTFARELPKLWEAGE